MPYDDMTENEYQDYYRLYKNPPKSVKGRAERFIELSGKGWGNTRAADDCFENGNGDAVLLLVLRRVRASPDLQRSLSDWSYWSENWHQQLNQFDEASFNLIVTEIEWRGTAIELIYRPNYRKAAKGISHLELQVISPDKTSLPITDTGYRSHFFPSQETLTEPDLAALVHEWLDEKAHCPKWQKLEQDRQQLTLF